jgi:predicted transcriptional regulator
MQLGSIVKTSSIPSLRVSQELRRQAEAVLQDGETLSSFVLNALTRSIEYRKARQAFIARGLASAARAQQTGRYVSADRVVGQLERRLAKAKRGVAKVR